MPKQTKSTIIYDRINGINKLTLKDNAASYYFTLFICGGPCNLSSLFSMFTSVIEKYNYERVLLLLDTTCTYENFEFDFLLQNYAEHL